MTTKKEPVRLRSRNLATGRKTLYLDIYNNGARSYEYLHLYLVPEHNREDREQNRQTLRLAEAIKAKRLVDFQNGLFGFVGSQYAPGASFIEYFRKVASTKKGSTQHAYTQALSYVIAYGGQNVTFQQITARWYEGLVRFFMGQENKRTRRTTVTLCKNTATLYLHKVRAVYLHAVRNGVVAQDNLRSVQLPTITPEERSFLTLEELKRLAATPCRSQIIRDMFLFSCLTGLRKSDILQMQWGMLDDSQDGGYLYKFHHRKTGRLQYLQISKQAASLLGERGANRSHVFPCSRCATTLNSTVARWALDAGINKHLSFHTGRHTFAVVMLELGVDIYTIQGLLNHASIATTQIYAKIVDKRKAEAVNSIPDIM